MNTNVIPGAPDRITLRQLAKRLGVCTRTILRWRLQGVRGVRLKSHRLGGMLYFTEADILAFVDAARKEMA